MKCEMLTLERKNRRWSLEEYHQMAEMGFFRDGRVELIDGEILEMAPQGSEHFACICLCADAMRKLFGQNHVVRVQGPLQIGSSEPEPDIAVVPGTAREYAGKSHPSTALLVVEISDSSLEFDRHEKGTLYARAGIADYWIVNLVDRVVEVYRKPVVSSSAKFGFGYEERTVHSAMKTIKVLALPVEICVADILP
jgi:Uma2 family endonuclease